jgi:hypothetical protein
MLIKLAAALTVSGAVAATTGWAAASADTADPTGTTSTTSTTSTSTTVVPAPSTTTTVASGSASTTSTSSSVPATASTSTSAPATTSTSLGARPAGQAATTKPDNAPVAGAYYGNPKPGVEIAVATPGLYPVFGASSQPDLTGFSVVAAPASTGDQLAGVPDPQPVCSPDEAAASTPAPNLFCQADTNDGYEFPMKNFFETFDFSVSSGPPGFVHDPDQTVPISFGENACPAPSGQDSCAQFSSNTPDFFFEYIGIYRPLEVTVTSTSGRDLNGVSVTLSCTAPAGDPSYACGTAGEKTNAYTGRANPSSTSTQTATTNSNGVASFSGAFLPGVAVTASAAPPPGYGAAATTDSVPSPVTASTTTGAEISSAARTPVDLRVELPAAAPATTTTTTSAPTSTTVPVTTPTTAHPASPASALPLTGTSAESVAEDAGLLLLAGAGLVTASRRRARKGAHFEK